MKILHLCLGNYYVDNFGYQENIITKAHKKLGHNVQIIASTETLLKTGKLDYVVPSSYETADGIPIQRIKYSSALPHYISRKVRCYPELPKLLEESSPDLIFIHNVAFLSIRDVIKYAKRHPNVKIVADSHIDTINSAQGFISLNILHGIFYRYCAQLSLKVVQKYYSTLPIRGVFLEDVYGIPHKLISFLPMGLNDIDIDISQKGIIRSDIRLSLNIKEDDFVIITGGRLRQEKNIHILIEAFKTINHPKVKLLIIGTPVDEYRSKFHQICQGVPNLINVGWVASSLTYKYFMASDLICFPGSHSALWEETVGLGIPGVFKHWPGIDHVKRGGNSILLKDISVLSLSKTIQNIILNKDQVYTNMSLAAKSEELIKFFSYRNIAERSINI